MTASGQQAPADGIAPRPMPFAFDLVWVVADGKPATVMHLRTLYGTLPLWIDDDFSKVIEDALRTTRGGLHVPNGHGLNGHGPAGGAS